MYIVHHSKKTANKLSGGQWELMWIRNFSRNWNHRYLQWTDPCRAKATASPHVGILLPTMISSSATLILVLTPSVLKNGQRHCLLGLSQPLKSLYGTLRKVLASRLANPDWNGSASASFLSSPFRWPYSFHELKKCATANLLEIMSEASSSSITTRSPTFYPSCAPFLRDAACVPHRSQAKLFCQRSSEKTDFPLSK